MRHRFFRHTEKQGELCDRPELPPIMLYMVLWHQQGRGKHVRLRFFVWPVRCCNSIKIAFSIDNLAILGQMQEKVSYLMSNGETFCFRRIISVYQDPDVVPISGYHAAYIFVDKCGVVDFYALGLRQADGIYWNSVLIMLTK